MSQWISLDQDPINVFTTWFNLAQKSENFEPTQMTLATVDANQMPSARVVLLKQFDASGFCFFTNYTSVKAQQIDHLGKAALVFHWALPYHRQIRVRGLVEKMSYQESNAYFQTRHRGSQIGAWASPQSQPIEGRQELIDKQAHFQEKFAEGAIPCPEDWGGFRVKPLTIEFWQAGEHRLHDRVQFSRTAIDNPWQAQYLAP